MATVHMRVEALHIVSEMRYIGAYFLQKNRQ